MSDSYRWSDAGRDVAAAIPAGQPATLQSLEEARRAKDAAHRAQRIAAFNEISQIVQEFWSTVRRYQLTLYKEYPLSGVAAYVRETWRPDGHASITFARGVKPSFRTSSDGLWLFTVDGPSDYSYDNDQACFGVAGYSDGTPARTLLDHAVGEDPNTPMLVKKMLAAWLMMHSMPLPS